MDIDEEVVMTTKTAKAQIFKVGDLITYPGFPETPYKVTRRHGQLYNIVDAHHCTINRVSLQGCQLVTQ